MLIEFLLGLLVCIPLLPFNDLILKWAKKDPQKSLAIVTFMIFLFFFTLYNVGVFDRQL